MRVEGIDRLRSLYARIAAASGADADEAAIVADCFARADLRGRDTQGIACFPLIYSWVRSGAIRFGAPIERLREGSGYAVVDGGHGAGQVVATRAMEIAIEKAKAAGTGSVWVRNTNDFAMASNYALQALEQDCVGLVMSTNIPYVAPWGGRDPVFSASPVAFAIPAASYDPIVHDSHFSAEGHGRVVLAARDGARLPEPWLVDADGAFTDDPASIVVDPFDRNSPQTGAILPSGGPKGSGWLFFVDAVAGILSGLTASSAIVHDPTDSEPSTQAHWLLAVDLCALGDPEAFKARVDELIASVKASVPADGFEQVSYPGERAAAEERRRKRDGVPVREEDWTNLMAIAAELGLP